MNEVDLFKQAYASYKEQCATERQSRTFLEYCHDNGVPTEQMCLRLKMEYQTQKVLCGDKAENGVAVLCTQVYDDFKRLCADGRQPGTFKSYCDNFGITRSDVHNHLSRKGLRVDGLPGFSRQQCGGRSQMRASGAPQCGGTPFEDVIFEEAGFLPATGGKSISVRVGARVTIDFPADASVATVACFVREILKGVGHVGA